ncbi:hypothetical protein HPB49_013152 [Dermacentor silvarum]|uniref:Uncharacterized protein n=1 Tax=Dermacentor silvarum TaxID=543639 RepID=A0ACB8C9L5_DERSI|nr:hypothetical protein HPB49_013152 [Dermacentor silvarum]
MNVCGLHALFWPTRKTHALTPTLKHFGNTIDPEVLRAVFQDRRQWLEEVDYDSLEDVLTRNGSRYEEVCLRVLKAEVNRPTMFLKLEPCQKFVNAFSPWIASVLRSNMDIQLTEGTYSCAAYVVDYMKRANRGL